MLPPPSEFGLPAKYTAWREGQDAAIVKALDSEKRVLGCVLPTGFGKSLMYMAAGRLMNTQTVILTSTRALQRQLEDDFGEMDSTILVQGQRAYICEAMTPAGFLFPLFGRERGSMAVTVDHAPCHAGVDCRLKLDGCEYFDRIRRAAKCQTIITNYAWWFTLVNRPDIRLQPGLLVCDEAHEAPSALADALGAEVRVMDVTDFLGAPLGPAAERTSVQWVQFAKAGMQRLAQLLDGTQARTSEALKRLRRAQWLKHALERIAAIDPDLLLTSDTPDGVRFDLVWAAPYAEQYLFRQVPKVLMTSATFGAHTAELLGVAPADLDLYEAGDGFPVERRPIYQMKGDLVPRVDHRMTADAEQLWITLIDNILRDRGDRKGIIHTVSYKRRDALITRSRYRERMVTHDRHNTAERIEIFKKAKPGTILISPSVTTGYDFPYDECEFQIITKVPFPDARDPVTKARSQIDKKYPAYLAMQEIVQGVGRGMRAEDDQCETFLVDGHFGWFFGRHIDLAPRWFRRAIRRVTTVPDPPPALASHT